MSLWQERRMSPSISSTFLPPWAQEMARLEEMVDLPSPEMALVMTTV